MISGNIHRIANLKGVRLFFLLFAVSFASISVGAMKTGYKVPVADALGYVKQANGFSVFPKTGSDEQRPGIVFAPFYPAFLAGMAQIDADVDEALACYGESRQENCDVNGLASVYWMQILVASLSGVLLFYAAENVAKNRAIAVLTFALILLAGKFHDYSVWLITETWYFFFFFVFVYFSSAFLFVKNSMIYVLGAGAALALAVLVRPSYLYLYYTLLVTVPLYQLLTQRGAPVKALSAFVALVFPLLVMVVPWMLRNLEYYNVFGVSAGYAAYILSERVTYNFMNWPEFAVSWLYWLPDFGDSLAASLFAAEYWQRLDFGHPEGFYRVGNEKTRSLIYSLAQTDGERVKILLNQYILEEPFKHVMVTFALAWRGMFISKYFGLLGALALVPAFLKLKASVSVGQILALVFPFYFMLGFNAFVSVNVPRYNVPLIFIYSLAVSVLLVSVVSAFRKRKQ